MDSGTQPKVYDLVSTQLKMKPAPTLFILIVS